MNKPEIRNPKQIRMTKKNRKQGFWGFEIHIRYSNFDIVSDFEIRVSDFIFVG